MTTTPVHESVSYERVTALLDENPSAGCCIACGRRAAAVKPEAVEHACDHCGELAVYGAEELLIRELFLPKPEAGADADADAEGDRE